MSLPPDVAGANVLAALLFGIVGAIGLVLRLPEVDTPGVALAQADKAIMQIAIARLKIILRFIFSPFVKSTARMFVMHIET